MSSDTSNRHSTEDLDKSQFSSDSEEEVVKSPKSKRKKAETKPKKSPEKKSYRCDRCNFSSGSKAKYTKHAKSAHSGTIVQCDHCEFKTPYKWNLDRHYKNHLGGGALCCHLCNFSCDIKQSLTVHLQNHHSNVPEEVIESVKRQQIPSRNQSINNNNNINANSNSSAAATTAATAASSNANASADTNSNSSATGNDGAASENLPEKKVPPLRISRSLTGLSLGEETNSGANSTSNTSKKEEESAAAASSTILVQNAPLPVGTGSIPSNESISSALAAGNDEAVRNARKCEQCDFEITGEGNGSYISIMKKHMTNQHGVNRSGKHHKRLRASSRSTSPENSDDSSPANPSLPVVPIPLPPKKSKGSTSPRPGQSASSSSNSPAIHRSQSPLKASEAISAYASNDHNLHAAGLLDNDHDHQHRHQSVLSAIQSRHSQLQSSGEESAFTPVGSSDFSQAQLSLLKKPKQRALAQFYQKLKTKFSAATEDNESTFCAPVESEATETAKDDVNEDSQKNTSLSSPLKSNRCQHCRQRCKSSADLAYHLERCPDAKGKAEKKDEAETFSETAKGEMKVKTEKELPGKTLAEGTFQIPQKLSGSTKPEVEESDEGDYETKVQHLNGSTVDINDGLIGFETAPGVGAIHTGKLDEIEYQGYQQDGNENGSHREESSDNRPIEHEHEEEEDEEIDESTVGRKPAGKNSKATITSRKVYRCPESDCSFWATTASRFHVHIVGHYNLKPFECSECHYKSNWRWDVNKHIRLKTPKDPKHAIAKTLLTHESGQRDYRKYDNYLVAMSLTHSANAKAPDCSTAASKRIRNVVASPKSSPEIQAASATSRTESPNGSGGNSGNTPTSFVPVSGKQKSSKLTKTPASSSSSTNSSIPPSATSEENGNSYGFHSQNAAQLQPDEAHAYPMDLAPISNSSSEGRSFVETRMLAGGEIYQTSLLKPDIGMNVNNDGDHQEGDGTHSTVFDLTLKRPRSRHRDRRQSPVDEIQKTQATEAVVQHDMEAHSVTPPMPTKKSRLQQSEYQQQTSQYMAGAATNGSENKILSMWQCIKCNFKHSNKDVVNTHIRDQHKPKKGDPVSLLAHNHLIQVMIPEEDCNSPEGVDYSARSITSDLNKEIFQQTFTEVGKVLSCKFCPFTTGLLYEMEIHADHHLNKSTSYYSCPHCSYSVAVKSELQEHLKLHGDIFQSHEIQNKLINSSTAITPSNDSAKLSLLSPTSTTENLSMGKKDSKKYYCSDCPYATQDVSEFQYHKQCHEPMGYPFKCHICTFNVSVKFHLLQHLGVHGIQIDEVGIPQTSLDPTYGYSNDYESSSADHPQEEPLNLSIFANRKPVVIWDNNGTAIEGYRCTVCPQIFQDLNDLKEHEFVNNHRGNANSGNSNDSFIDKRQCDSPPSEAMNLCVKPVDNSTKKSSQNNSKVNSSAGKKSSSNISNTGCPLSISPSQIAIDQNSGSSSTKAEKEYLYLCDECPARFFFEKELKIHHTFHENKSIFSCPKCTYSARQKDPHLMSHMRVHGTAYQEKTKALLLKFPRAKVNLSPSASASAAVAASVASLLNSSILNPNFNLQTAAAALSSAVGKLKPGNCVNPSFPDPSAIDGLRKNGLSIACPKCPENFYTPSSFQQHIELHSNGRTPATDYRCRFCDYCAESRKCLIVHEMVHTGSDITLEPSAAAAAAVVAAGKLLPSSAAFNPVSMMALIAHQDSPFSSVANAALNAAGLCSTAEPDNSEKTSVSVPDEAYEGNPEFVYPTYMKNGRVKSKRYKCMKCPSAFEKKDQYHTHIGLHGSNQKYKCTVCDYAVTYYANYIQHLKKHENQQNIPSELLNLGRKRHVDEDGNGSLLKIPKMAENGENSSSSSVSGASIGSVDSNENQSVMKCSLCPFHCYDESTLESHLVHHQENPNWLHVCSICSYRTSSKKSLKEHARLHLLSGFHHIQNQPDWRNGEQNTNGTESHQGEYVNGYANNHRYHSEKQHQNFEGEVNDDSSNGSL